jgi:hypothetical protein
MIELPPCCEPTNQRTSIEVIRYVASGLHARKFSLHFFIKELNFTLKRIVEWRNTSFCTDLPIQFLPFRTEKLYFAKEIQYFVSEHASL